jgi:agmatinase
MNLRGLSGGPAGEGLPFTGVATFLGWPTPAAPTPTESGRCLVALGVPYDEGTAYRSGARLAPRALRDASMRLRFATSDGLAVFDVQRRRRSRLAVEAWDGGDVDVTPLQQARTFAAIAAAVGAVRGAGAVPVVLGGDNSITLPALEGIADPGVVVVQLDAHLDYGEHYFGAAHGNSTPLRAARRGGHCSQVVHLGARGYDNAQSDLEATERDGNVLVTSDACRDGAGLVAVEALAPGTRVYVSIDIDVADPAIAPGTGYLEPGGLDYAQLRRLLLEIGSRCELVGCELVEVAPPYDVGGATALLGVQLLVDLLSAHPDAADAERGERG